MTSLCYVVTHIETDGPLPGENSLRSLASVAVDPAGATLGEFEIRFAPLEGAAPHSGTLAWFKTRPDAWEDATRDPQSPEAATKAYVAWLGGLGASPVFASNQLAFMGLWIDWYFRKFIGAPWMWGLRLGDPPFTGSGLDLRSFIMAKTGRDYGQCTRANYPAQWFGPHTTSHIAREEARGWAHVLSGMLKKS